MISVITCSRSLEDFQTFERNVKATAGVPVELIRIDNSQGRYNLFQAYNEGMRQASGDLLCFAHEDIQFFTRDWGRKVEQHFAAHAEMGYLGVAGGTIFPKGADWRAMEEGGQCHLLQRFATLEPQPRHFTALISNKAEGKLVEVAAIDGLWMVLRGSLAGTVRFDEDTFNGYHLYDTDSSMQVRKAGYKVYVCRDILIEHFSTGSFSEEYFAALDKCLQKWDAMLPIALKPRKQPEKSVEEIMSAYRKDRLMEHALRQKLAQGATELSPEEKALVRPNVRLFHHVYEKNSPSIQDSLREIERSLQDGFITADEARYFRRKTWLYHTLLKPMVRKYIPI